MDNSVIGDQLEVRAVWFQEKKNKMDKLPNEMLMKIFQNVDQVDQLLNCKIVCKDVVGVTFFRIQLDTN